MKIRIALSFKSKGKGKRTVLRRKFHFGFNCISTPSTALPRFVFHLSVADLNHAKLAATPSLVTKAAGSAQMVSIMIEKNPDPFDCLCDEP